MRKKRQGFGLTKQKSVFEFSKFCLEQGISLRKARLFIKKNRFKGNKRGQAGFVFLVITVLTLLIFIFASPILFAAVGIGAASTGTATGFVIRLFPWVILIILIAVGYRLIIGGG